MADSVTHEIAACYADALAADDDTSVVLGLMSNSARFESPFTVWEDPGGIRAAYTARSAAFSGLVVMSVITQNDHAVLLWQADVSGQPVEGCEVLTFSAAEVCRVDVYLRPASVLPVVHAAMKAAWPR